MKTLKTIDEFVLQCTQRAADAFQILTGWDCLDVARSMFTAWSAFILSKHLARHQYWLVGVQGFFLGIYIVGTHLMDREIRRNALMGLRNIRRVERRYIRYLCYVLLPFAILLDAGLPHAALEMAADSLFFGCYPLEACDPLPPQRGKIRQWLTLARTPQAIRVSE